MAYEFTGDLMSCAHGCPGLCTPRCVAAGKCVVMGFLDLETEEGRILAALAGIGAALVGAPASQETRAMAEAELPVLCESFRRFYNPEKVKEVLGTLVHAEMERQERIRRQ